MPGYSEPRPGAKSPLDQMASPAVRTIAPRPPKAQDAGFGDIAAVSVAVSSAVDIALFNKVSGGVVFVRNMTTGGSAFFLLDSSFPAGGVLVSSNGGAIWNAGAPAAGEVRLFMGGESIMCRSGATRNGNLLDAVM